VVDTLSLTIGELASMVGISTDTIRAWERRHALLSPHRTVTGHRRYGMDDVETLRRVRQNVAVRRLSLKLAIAEAQGLLVEAAVPVPMPVLTVVDAAGGRSEAPWRAVADLLPNVVCIVNPTGEIIDTNMAFAHMTGVLRLELRGKRFLDLIEPANRAKAVRLYKPEPQRRRGWELNLRTRTVSGLFAFDSYVVPTMASAFIVLIGTDLSSSGLELWPQSTELPVQDSV